MHTNVGHRQRVKERFRAEGLDNFDESHVLELLLFYVLPRQDTKPLARRLLDHFGSLRRVLDADVELLQTVEGVGINIATFLHLMSEVGRYYLVRREDPKPKLEDLNTCGQYLANYFHGKTRETVYLLCLDAGCRPLCVRKLGEGSVSSIQLSNRQVMEVALATGATSVILAHNHPGGLAFPSREDMATTKRICAALASVEVLLADHMVVADGDFVSMVQAGDFCPEKYRLLLV